MKPVYQQAGKDQAEGSSSIQQRNAQYCRNIGEAKVYRVRYYPVSSTPRLLTTPRGSHGRYICGMKYPNPSMMFPIWKSQNTIDPMKPMFNGRVFVFGDIGRRGPMRKINSPSTTH
jgi:hypothetical protein